MFCRPGRDEAKSEGAKGPRDLEKLGGKGGIRRGREHEDGLKQEHQA
jgi:hypothetical protein